MWNVAVGSLLHRFGKILAVLNGESGQVFFENPPNPNFSGFPEFDPNAGGGGGGAYTEDLGNGLIGVFNSAGQLVDVRSAPTPPSASGPGPLPRTQFESERLLDLAQVENLGGQTALGTAQAQRLSDQTAIDQRALDQFDRDLDFRIQSTEDQLDESRRQFDISTGLERERIAEQMARLEKQLANDMAIAQLDSRTRLDIAGMQSATARRGQDITAATTKRGQNISREQFGLNLQARRAEFGATNLGRDVARQALFELGGSGGTTPLELAAQQFPTAEIPQISAAKGTSVSLKDRPVAIRVGEGGEEIVLASKNRIEVIPEVASAQEGISIDPSRRVEHLQDVMRSRQGRINAGRTRNDLGEAAPVGRDPNALLDARRTLSDLLGRSFESDPMARFGGLPEIEPFFGQDVEAPSKMAYSFSQKSPAVQRVLLSVLGVRGFDQEEALRRMRAATPESVFSGIARSR